MQRLDYIDQMKGLAILSVVVGHIYLPHTDDGIFNPIASMIYSCHMSFFFFLSGFVNNISNGIETKGVINFVRKKVESLLIPYFFTIFIMPIFLYNRFPHDFQSIINLLSFFPIGLYWFLPVLFIFMMLFLFRYCLTKKKNKYELSFNILSIGVFFISGILLHQYFLVIYGIYWYAFILGDIISKYDSLKRIITSNIIFGSSSLILCIAWKFYPLETNNVAWKSMINLLLSFICSTTACITIYNLFLKAVIPQWIKKYLQEMGKFSLVIYILPISILPKDFTFPNYIPYTVLNLIILTIGIIHTLVSYSLGRIIFEIPYLRYIMFGKK